MKRLIILSGVYPNIKCGVAYHTWVVAQAVAALGDWDVHVVTSRSDRVDMDRDRNFELHPVIEGWTLSALPSIAAGLKALNPDVIHIQYPTNAYKGRLNFALPMLPRLGRRFWNSVRTVVTQHDLAIGHRVMQWKHGLLLKRADAVTVSNDRDYQAVLRLGPQVAGRTYLAPVASHFDPPALSDAEKAEVRRELAVPDGGGLLVYFGFIVPGRKIETLLHAAAVLKRRDFPFRLVVMGGAGPGADAYMASCKTLTTGLRLDDAVAWTGYASAETVNRTIAAADIFISPIERGADFRNSSLFPAMQAGVPVLTTENTEYGVDRELRASGACMFFDPNDPAGLADAVVSICEDRDARCRMTEAALNAMGRHTWEEHARVLNMAYTGATPEPYPFDESRAGR
ncbi:MAG: glycosyltransferase family 4 protein [Planctomycetes bacterium]|nr:glycosyltransferase family 4 protein [Planctomycetota bacterium]